MNSCHCALGTRRKHAPTPVQQRYIDQFVDEDPVHEVVDPVIEEDIVPRPDETQMDEFDAPPVLESRAMEMDDFVINE